MNASTRWCVAALAACAGLSIASAATAQDPGSAPAQASTYEHPYQQGVEPKTFDFFVPVVAMEQHYSGTTRLQGYRIQLFADGRGIYHGLKNVKVLGEVRFHVSIDQLQKIKEEFRRYKFWDVPADQFGSPKGQPSGFGLLTVEFTLREGQRTKTVRFGAMAQGSMLWKVVEDEVQSSRWRCPFVEEGYAERCAAQEKVVDFAVRVFLDHDLPRLLELYK